MSAPLISEHAEKALLDMGLTEHETLTSVASIYFHRVWDNAKPLKYMK